MGINLWFAPQISEHCPNITPGRCTIRRSIFIRPGTASTFTPKDGTVHACKTSAEVISKRMWVLNGTNIRLSTSSKRNMLSCRSMLGTIYESNSTIFSEGPAQKSLYSYLQYHWWAKILTENVESIDSSNIYSSSNEGIAICTRTIAGIIVQIPSIIWLSSKFFVVNLFKPVLIIQYPTNEIINTKIIQIKSCKKKLTLPLMEN